MEKNKKAKSLKAQLKKLKVEQEVLKIRLICAQKEYESKRSLIKNIQTKIDAFNQSESIKISEHAMLRYFERIKGYNLKEIESEILTSDVLELMNQLGVNGTYPNKHFKIVIRDHVVVTVI